MVLKIHPDKPNGDREIYELANLSYLILKSTEKRKIYDEERLRFIQNNKSFMDLKSNKKDFNKNTLTKEEAIKEYNLQQSILNEKHGFVGDNINPISQSEMMKRLNDLTFNRGNFINSHNNKTKKQSLSNYDFNEKFIKNGTVNEDVSNEIIAFNDSSSMSISSYSGINNFELYSSQGCNNSNYSSLDSAFNQSIPSTLVNGYSDHNSINDNDRSKQKDRLAEYNNMTQKLKSMKISDFN